MPAEAETETEVAAVVVVAAAGEQARTYIRILLFDPWRLQGNDKHS